MELKSIGRSLRDLWLSAYDPRRLREIRGERVAFRHLQSDGFFRGLEGKRFLEIGPKHGEDSLLLASLKPKELVLLDLPEKADRVHSWIPRLSCPVTYVEGNLLYLSPEEFQELGTFDLVWCLGVLYHNVEQARLLRAVLRLVSPHGKVVVESATTRNRRLHRENVVELHWPETYRGVPTITHLPSRRAIGSWMEMVGFSEVTLRDVYSRGIAWQRAVFTGIRGSSPRPYMGYGDTGANPDYVAGEAT